MVDFISGYRTHEPLPAKLERAGEALIEGCSRSGSFSSSWRRGAGARLRARPLGRDRRRPGRRPRRRRRRPPGRDRPRERDPAAAGGTGRSLRATAREQANEVTVNVEGDAPRLFSLPLLLPAVRASASLPVERYPTAEAAP